MLITSNHQQLPQHYVATNFVWQVPDEQAGEAYGIQPYPHQLIRRFNRRIQIVWFRLPVEDSIRDGTSVAILAERRYAGLQWIRT